MATLTYEDHGIRFEYPATWELEVSDEEELTTVTVQSSTGPAFAMITLDETRPTSQEAADEALSAMREEYPSVEVHPYTGVISGLRAVGHDLEFFTLDMVSECAIRAFRSPKQTVLVFAQWSTDDTGDDDEDPAEVVRTLVATLEETED